MRIGVSYAFRRPASFKEDTGSVRMLVVKKSGELYYLSINGCWIWTASVKFNEMIRKPLIALSAVRIGVRAVRRYCVCRSDAFTLWNPWMSRVQGPLWNLL